MSFSWLPWRRAASEPEVPHEAVDRAMELVDRVENGTERLRAVTDDLLRHVGRAR